MTDIFDAASMYGIGRIPNDSIGDLKVEIEKENRGEIKIMPFPWDNISKIFGGMRPGEVSILAGEPGAGKSYFALNVCLFVGKRRFSWKYLPFEDSATKHIRRAISIYDNDWSINSIGQIDIAKYESKMEFYRDIIGVNIFENPRKPIPYGDGDVYINTAKWKDVVEFVRETAPFCNLLVLDPITVIDFNEQYKRSFEVQSRFINELIAIISATNCHLFLVIHTTKSGEFISGSADFERICHNALIFRIHEEHISKSYDYENDVEDEIAHYRTLVIQKTRNGSGSRVRVAMDFSEFGPTFIEKGIIVGKSKCK